MAESSDCERELVINVTARSARELLEMNAGVEERSRREPKLKATGKPRKNDGGIMIPEAQSQTKLSMKITRSVTTDVVPSMNIVFQSDAGVLKAMGEDILAAFESESGGLAEFPAGKLKDKMESLTGKGQRRPTDLSHVQNTDLVYEITRRKETGAGRSDELVIMSIDQSALFMKSDYDAKKSCYLGIQDPAITIVARDLYDAGGCFVIMGPPYKWSQQLISDIPKASLETLYYDQPLCRLADDGTRVRDVFCVGHRDVSGKQQDAEKHEVHDRPHECLSGFTPASRHGEEIVLAGKKSDIPVRTGMGVSFTFDECPLPLREAVTGGGNPCLKACHGFVTSIGQTEEGKVELTARLLLGKGNLPPFLGWSRLSQEGVFQTNLQATFPLTWVVSSYRTLPLTLHTLPGFTSEAIFKIGNASLPYERNVFIAGHLDFNPGEFVAAGVAKAGNPPGAWDDRYKNEKLKAFVLISDFCARGGAVTDEAFKEHAIWKQKYSETIKAVPHCRPKAELHRIVHFPPGQALCTINQSQRLTAFPAFDPYLFDLRTALRRFAATKAKRAKSSAGSVCSLNVSIPGLILLQMVHQYAPDSTVHFKEGAVEAVVERFAQAESC